MLIGVPLLMARLFRGAATGHGPIYGSPISVNSGQVPSTQTDFPMLVSYVDDRFKTVANGGHVAGSNGYDIRPYSDAGLSSPLTYELERYNGSTGEIIMWVKVPSLSSSTTPIYLGYGDATLTTDGSSAATWSNSFRGVYHLADGTSLNVNSSTGSNNGTNHSATATSGQVDGAASLASSGPQYIDLGTGVMTGLSAVTVSAWVNATSFPGGSSGNYDIISSTDDVSAGGHYLNFSVKTNGKLACYVAVPGGTNVNYDGTGTNTLSTATWYHVAATYNSTAGLVGYVNGSVDKSVSPNGVFNSAGISTYIGQYVIGSLPWNGTIDEVRYSSVARSADWITTEYNNQSAPSTFATLGTEF